MKFTHEGSLRWYIGFVFSVIGFLFMFTKKEINDISGIIKTLKRGEIGVEYRLEYLSADEIRLTPLAQKQKK